MLLTGCPDGGLLSSLGRILQNTNQTWIILSKLTSKIYQKYGQASNRQATRQSQKNAPLRTESASLVKNKTLTQELEETDQMDPCHLWKRSTSSCKHPKLLIEYTRDQSATIPFSSQGCYLPKQRCSGHPYFPQVQSSLNISMKLWCFGSIPSFSVLGLLEIPKKSSMLLPKGCPNEFGVVLVCGVSVSWLSKGNSSLLPRSLGIWNFIFSLRFEMVTNFSFPAASAADLADLIFLSAWRSEEAKASH